MLRTDFQLSFRKFIDHLHASTHITSRLSLGLIFDANVHCISLCGYTIGFVIDSSLSTASMDLSLLEDDPLNTVVLLPGGQPLYSVETPFKLLGGRTTTIIKINGAQSTEVASIRWHTLGDPELLVLGNLLMPIRTGILSA